MIHVFIYSLRQACCEYIAGSKSGSREINCNWRLLQQARDYDGDVGIMFWMNF